MSSFLDFLRHLRETMQTLFAITLLLGAVSSMEVVRRNVEDMHHDEGWKVWKTGHEKRYGNESEEKVRYQIWKENLRRIDEHNKVYRFLP